MSAEFTPTNTKATEFGETANVDTMSVEQQFAFYNESTNGYWAEQGYTPESLAEYFAGFESAEQSPQTPEKLDEAASLRARVFEVVTNGADLHTIREIVSDIWHAVRRKVIPVTVALGLATTLAACGPTGEEPVETDDPDIVEETPEVEEPESTRYEGFDFERTDPLPADLEALDAMAPLEFATQPKTEQLRWASWVSQYMPEFAAAYGKVSGDPQYTSPYTLTPESDLMTQLQHSDMVEALGATLSDGPLPENPDYNGPLNEVDAQKFIMAHTSTEPESEWRVRQYMEKVGEDGQAFNVVRVARETQYESRMDAEKAPDFRSAPETIYIDGTPYQGWRVIYSTPEGGNANFTIAVVPFTDYTNAQAYDTVIGD